MSAKALFALFAVTLPCVVFARKLAPEVERAMAYGAEAKLCLKVCDDAGAPVSNASVRVVFDMVPAPHSVYGQTDANGLCVVKGKTNGNMIELLVGKDGYYGSRKKITFVKMRDEHKVKDGKWQPYGDMETIELREIRNPAPLTAAYMREFNNTKAINTWIGFDFCKRDFVQPYGNGEIADFEVFFDWDGKWLPDYSGMGIKIRFTDKFSGYYQCVASTVSEFKWTYSALPDAEYRQDAYFFERVINNPNTYGRQYERKSFDAERCWVVRSRCKMDADGNLVSANYSVIDNIAVGCDKGGVACVCVTGVFNPTPNDTNLEDVEAVKRTQRFTRQR